jgi:hypothetical protein
LTLEQGPVVAWGWLPLRRDGVGWQCSCIRSRAVLGGRCGALGATMKITVRRAALRRLARAATACVLAVGTGTLMAAGAAQAAAKYLPGCPVPVVSGATATVTCSYTGAAQYWTVPAGVTQATFTLYGAAGDTTDDSGTGGTGAEVAGTLPVTPGSVLQVNVGQAGANSGDAFGGGGAGGDGAGGGGGASDIRDGTDTLADRMLVAGGGGGAGADGGGATGGIAAGGAGGDADSAGVAGASAVGVCGETLVGGGGGGAGTTRMGGAGGAGNTSGSSCGGPDTPPNGAAGSEGSGGAGNGGWGGGGGGGYYGGGGGAGDAWDSEGPESGGGGGGGGASFTGTATGASVNDDPASPPPNGNGKVVISYHPVRAVIDHSLSGHETAVSCLTWSRCVAVGSQGGHGTVVAMADSGQSHFAVLDGAAVMDSVSCPSTSGCWAIGYPGRGAGAYLVKIGSTGRPAAERTLPVPAGTILGPISCASMTSCEIAGTDNRLHPAAIEIGTWNGAKLHLRRISVKGSTQVSIAGISCWHSDCEAVGSALVGSAGTDLIVTTKGGKPGILNANSGYALSGISCINATACYAAGAAVLVTVTGGAAADPQAVTGGWNGSAIECAGRDCEAAGGEVFGSAYADVLVSLSDGTGGSPVVVQTGQGFSGIAARGSSGFVAIGTGPYGAGTEVTFS